MQLRFRFAMAGVVRCADICLDCVQAGVFPDAVWCQYGGCFHSSNINVHEVLHLAGVPSRSLWSASRKAKNIAPTLTLLRRGSLRFSAALQSEGWFAEGAPER